MFGFVNAESFTKKSILVTRISFFFLFFSFFWTDCYYFQRSHGYNVEIFLDSSLNF